MFTLCQLIFKLCHLVRGLLCFMGSIQHFQIESFAKCQLILGKMSKTEFLSKTLKKLDSLHFNRIIKKSVIMINVVKENDGTLLPQYYENCHSFSQKICLVIAYSIHSKHLSQPLEMATCDCHAKKQITRARTLKGKKLAGKSANLADQAGLRRWRKCAYLVGKWRASANYLHLRLKEER